eukprot:2584926-Pyramimonas_sp.AAC.1
MTLSAPTMLLNTLLLDHLYNTEWDTRAARHAEYYNAINLCCFALFVHMVPTYYGLQKATSWSVPFATPAGLR